MKLGIFFQKKITEWLSGSPKTEENLQSGLYSKLAKKIGLKVN